MQRVRSVSPLQTGTALLNTSLAAAAIGTVISRVEKINRGSGPGNV